VQPPPPDSASLAVRSHAALSPAALFRQVAPSVFVVEALSAEGKLVATGSGVAVGPDVIVTNRHVVHAGPRLRVRHGSRIWPAVVAHLDPEYDLAQLTVTGLQAAPIETRRSTTLEVGEKVYSVGSPEGLELTLADGLVSALRRFPAGALVQHTAAISPGSSGGGLFDAEARLVGITTFYYMKGQNLNFALPAELAADLPSRASKSLKVAKATSRSTPPRPLPPAVLSLPSSGMLIGVDVRALSSCALYKQLRGAGVPGSADMVVNALSEARLATGIAPDRDVDMIVLSLSNLGATSTQGVFLAFGRFVRSEVAAALEASEVKKGQHLLTRELDGATLLTLSSETVTLALLDATTLVFGDTAQVEALVGRIAHGERPLDAQRSRLEELASQRGLFILANEGFPQHVADAMKAATLPVQEIALVTAFDDGPTQIALRAGSAVEAARLAGALLTSAALLQAHAVPVPQVQGVPGLATLLSQAPEVEVVDREVRVVWPLSLSAVVGSQLPALVRFYDEAAAVRDVRSVLGAEKEYRTASGGDYGELRCLQRPAECLAGYTGKSFLAAGSDAETRAGYRRRFHPGQPAAHHPQGLTSFAYTAVPEDPGRSGVRAFCGDSSGRICAAASGHLPSVVDGACPTDCTPLD